MHVAPLNCLSETPTPLPPPPRRIAFGMRGSGHIWFMRLFILPHTIAGIFVLGVFLGRAALLIAGVNGTGHITAIERSENRKNGPSYTVHFTYDNHAKIASGASTLNPGEYARLQRDVALEPGPVDLVGKPITIHYLALGSWRQAVLAGYSSNLIELGGLLLWLTFWWSVLSVFLWQAWGVPLRMRWLVKNGTAVTGSITDKQVRAGKDKTYQVKYSFTDPLTGQKIDQQMTTDARWYNRVCVGDAVTVLQHPIKPKRCTVYEVCPYQMSK